MLDPIEFTGNRYEETKGLDIAEIAKKVRAEIKEEKKAGRIPAEVKVSVKINRYAGGQSMDARITQLPQDLQVFNSEWLEDDIQGRPPAANINRYSDEMKAVLDQIEAIRDSYNRRSDDPQVDYFSARYRGWTQLDSKLRNDREAIEMAEVEKKLAEGVEEEVGAEILANLARRQAGMVREP